MDQRWANAIKYLTFITPQVSKQAQLFSSPWGGSGIPTSPNISILCQFIHILVLALTSFIKHPVKQHYSRSTGRLFFHSFNDLFNWPLLFFSSKSTFQKPVLYSYLRVAVSRLGPYSTTLHMKHLTFFFNFTSQQIFSICKRIISKCVPSFNICVGSAGLC